MNLLVFRVWHISVPYHPEVLRSHQNYFCPLARRGDRGFEIDGRETRTETLQTWQARLRECHTCPICQHFPAWFCGNQGHRIPHAGPRRPPMCALCDDVPVVECNNEYNENKWYNDHKCNNTKHENFTLARSHIFNWIPKHGPSSSLAIIHVKNNNRRGLMMVQRRRCLWARILLLFFFRNKSQK